MCNVYVLYIFEETGEVIVVASNDQKYEKHCFFCAFVQEVRKRLGVGS